MKQRQRLNLETLEPRQMLSTVAFTATGETGQENLVVTIGDQEVINQVVSSEGENFVVDLGDNDSLSDLRIQFTNDLFQENLDRNLTIDRLAVDGQEVDFSSTQVFSTGTWTPGDFVQPGFGRGNTLHSNGFFQFDPPPTSTTVQFNGNQWTASRGFSQEQISIDPVNNELILSGIDREISIAREVDIVAGSFSRLTVDAWRNQIAGSFQGAPAGAGIDVFDAEGDFIQQVSFQLNENANDPSDRVQTQGFQVSERAATAYLWVWTDGFPEYTNIPLRLTDLRVEEVDTSVDVTPPTIRLVNEVEAEFLGRGDAFFTIEIEDEFPLFGPDDTLPSPTLELTDPSGSVLTPVLASGGSFGLPDNVEQLFYRINEEFGTFDELVLGEYEVRLVGDDLVDAAGNVTPPQFIGVFTLV